MVLILWVAKISRAFSRLVSGVKGSLLPIRPPPNTTAIA